MEVKIRPDKMKNKKALVCPKKQTKLNNRQTWENINNKMPVKSLASLIHKESKHMEIPPECIIR